MKKWIIAGLILILAIVVAPYLVVPNPIAVQKTVLVNVSQKALRRLMFENVSWNKDWPRADTTGAIKDSGRSVFFNGNTYSLADKKYTSLILTVQKGTDTIANASLNMVEISKGLVKLDWVALVPSPGNPFDRWKSYRQAKKLESDLGYLLSKIDSFYSKPSNVYGISIRQEPVTDTTLLFVYDSSRRRPTTDLIYSLIAQLKSYASAEGAAVTGYPMLNIFTQDSVTYVTKVAVPVNKELPSKGKIAYKWMLPHGNILVADVKGGQKKIDSVLEQMDYFIKDFGRNAPAIPFVSLITDRMQERDSSKWLTRVYFPVME